MHELVQRWCECRPCTRLFLWCVGTSTTVLIAYLLLVRPIHTEIIRLNTQVINALHVNASKWPGAIRQTTQLKATVPGRERPFSPLEFQAEGTRLVHWRPRQGGGELVLDAGWEQIPEVFSRLALRDVKVSAFTLAPEGSLLRLSVQLEQNDAN
ncbi:hypothetical protein [Enterobacter sp. RHBSTW-00994]|uniref:HofO family protein n=1 Tax=Enterobacter sp. RHBSTW-00994 TaxID=2742676 RepID=UPI002016C51B|nr:hypothetical protein [Enterobacter sp. RHBSTW-00994]